MTDNVLWDGKVVPGYTNDPSLDADTRAIAEYNERIHSHPDLLTSVVPLRDGVAISFREADERGRMAEGGNPPTPNDEASRSSSRYWKDLHKRRVHFATHTSVDRQNGPWTIDNLAPAARP